MNATTSIRACSSTAIVLCSREQRLVLAPELGYDQLRSQPIRFDSARMNFLTPQFFDMLVIATIVSGLLLAAARVRRDFQQPPRFPEDELPKE